MSSTRSAASGSASTPLAAAAQAASFLSGTSSCFKRSSIWSAGDTRSSGRSSPVRTGSPSFHISSRARIQRSAPARIRKLAGTPTSRPSARSQPSAIEWKVPTAGAGSPIRSSIRSRISAAARSVNVITRIDAGGAPPATSRRKRSAITAVFPVPAPATTRTAPRPIAAARACSTPSFTTVLPACREGQLQASLLSSPLAGEGQGGDVQQRINHPE